MKQVNLIIIISSFLQSCVLYNTKDVTSDVTDKYSNREKDEYYEKLEKAGGQTQIWIPSGVIKAPRK